MTPCVLDTTILSDILLNRDQLVERRARQYVRSHGCVQFSAVTRYEVVRGHRLHGALGRLQNFERFCEHNRVLPVTDAVLDLAADLWCQARRLGVNPGDADLLIGATAMELGCSLITSNFKDFSWIADLELADWRVP